MKVLDMKPYKDPDEFMKNLGREEFQKRIDSAVGSFMFEISVIRSQYNMQDPESRRLFIMRPQESFWSFRKSWSGTLTPRPWPGNT